MRIKRKTAAQGPVHLLRIGFGFDVHRFSSKKKDLMLGGIKIAAPFGIDAVSDGDAVLHAACDALCGAAGLGDIGDMFPPGSKRSKGIRSTKILDTVLKKMKNRYQLLNLDLIIITDRPKLAGHKKRMVTSLKKLFKTGQVNVKIKSKEKLDILGGTDSLCVMAQVLMKKCQK
ncbi:MAG: 2-C-methyl-D-erythritol 2,4-cyclodiphosphate synthase [Candidatus Omnitrophica bacterium]|nr:2-C-methyl-D-erythritol 2,4-cyclodiphosphate synthase [Candidatus Omnitrophota bacterium]